MHRKKVLAKDKLNGVSIPVEKQLKLNLFKPDRINPANEDPDYLTKQLITYIGNKRALLDFIGRGITVVQNRLGKKKLAIADVFSGSGVVARYMKQFSQELMVNDLEAYSEVINRCYLSNPSELDINNLRNIHETLVKKLKELPLKRGFISNLYAPKDESNIQPGERVFYTVRNAGYLDTARQYIETIDKSLQHFFIAPLLSEASVHANTSGVFKGFYKDRKTGIGWFGGRNRDALTRIMGDITLPFPIFSRFECEYSVYRLEAKTFIKKIKEVDVAYLDPPYNQHPYGSNYFMLNLIVQYKKPENISKVSGIPENWNRSLFNSKKEAFAAFYDLVKNIKAKFLLISFNSEGFISLQSMMDLLTKVGKVTLFEQKYNTFRGSRNLKRRSIHVKEYLYLVEKKEENS